MLHDSILSNKNAPDKLNRQENFIQDYCNSVERLNSTPLKQKVGEF